MKKVAHNIMYIIYVIIKPKFFNLLNIRLSQLYSMYKSNEFREAKKCHFQYPLYLHGGKYIKLGDNFGADHRLRLDAWDEFLGDKFTPEIVFGNNVFIQKDCHIGATNKIIIGNNVLLASKVFITDHYHGEINIEALKLPPAQRRLFSKGPVIIEDNVWIGEGVVVLPNVTIGENSIIGANSVITKSIPKNSVVGGNPSRILRTLE